jgi:transposase
MRRRGSRPDPGGGGSREGASLPAYGAGLARWLRGRGMQVIEVERPKGQDRRRRGKSDALDAEAAARAVQAGTATALPKAGDGPSEMVRTLQAARRSTLKARPQAANQLHALVVTAPDALRSQLRRLSRPRLVATAAAFRPRLPLTTPTAATQLALKSQAVRYQQLTAEIELLEAQLELLVAELGEQVFNALCGALVTLGLACQPWVAASSARASSTWRRSRRRGA